MQAQSLDNVQEKDLNSLKVLIIDDDLTIKTEWEYILRKFHDNIHISWAMSSHEAEFKLRRSFLSKNYDLVITDIFLSGPQTGIDLWVRYHEQLMGKMIMMSGISYPKFLNSLERERVDFIPPFIQKPLNPKDCLNTLYAYQSRGEA